MDEIQLKEHQMVALSPPTPWALRAATGGRAPAARAERSLRPAAPAVPRRACAYVFISNLPHLAQAYGQEFASAASLEVQRRLCAHFLASAADDMARLRDDCFLLWANDAFVCGAGDIRDLPHDLRSASRPIETLLAVL